jgi:hypothetical protein
MNVNGRITTVEQRYTGFLARCDLCESFVEMRRRQEEAEDILRSHLRDDHNVRPKIVLNRTVPFVRVADFTPVEEKENASGS